MQAAVGTLTKLFPFGALALATKLFKKPKAPIPQRPATRDDARDAALKNDELARRRGGAADMVTGPTGAEPSSASVGKTSLGD